MQPCRHFEAPLHREVLSADLDSASKDWRLGRLPGAQGWELTCACGLYWRLAGPPVCNLRHLTMLTQPALRRHIAAVDWAVQSHNPQSHAELPARPLAGLLCRPGTAAGAGPGSEPADWVRLSMPVPMYAIGARLPCNKADGSMFGRGAKPHSPTLGFACQCAACQAVAPGHLVTPYPTLGQLVTPSLRFTAFTYAGRRTLPASWAKMPQIIALSVDTNALTGPLPPGWGSNNSFPALVMLSMVHPNTALSVSAVRDT